MVTRVLVVTMTLVLALAAPAAAAFQYVPANPHSAAMGGTIMTEQGDSATVFLNPASLSALPSIDLYFVHNRLYTGLGGVDAMQEGLFSLGAPLPEGWGTVGAGLATFRATGLVQERTVALTYARRFGRVDLGVAGKHLSHSYDAASDPLAAQDPVFRAGTSRSAVSLDLGLGAALTDSLRLGLAARNVNEPDVGLASEDKVSRELQGGLSYELSRIGLRGVVDVAYRDAGFADGRRVLPSVGLEKALGSRKVVLRAGASILDYSAGFGVRLGRVGFDYALILRRNLLEGNAGTHSFGVRFQFGGPSARTRAAISDDPDMGAGKAPEPASGPAVVE